LSIAFSNSFYRGSSAVFTASLSPFVPEASITSISIFFCIAKIRFVPNSNTRDSNTFTVKEIKEGGPNAYDLEFVRTSVRIYANEDNPDIDLVDNNGHVRLTNKGRNGATKINLTYEFLSLIQK
jgi:hypothetical protein